MSQCKYIYQDGDKIPAGFKPGDRCVNPKPLAEGKKGEGYCWGHALKMAYTPEERSNLMTTGPGKRKKYEKRKVVSPEVDREIELLSKTPDQRKAFMRNTAKKLYHKILNDINVDLEEMVNDFIEQKGERAFVDSDEHRKSMFIIWWCADPETKKPQDFGKVAKLLQYKIYELKLWMSTDDFAQEIEKQSTHAMRLLVPFVNRENSIRALMGDDKAVDFFNGQISKSFDKEDDQIYEKLDKMKDEFEKIVTTDTVRLDKQGIEVERAIEKAVIGEINNG
jgi:hypothetical protein